MYDTLGLWVMHFHYSGKYFFKDICNSVEGVIRDLTFENVTQIFYFHYLKVIGVHAKDTHW